MKLTRFLLFLTVTLAFGSEPIPVNTKSGKVEQTSSGTGTLSKPYDFSEVSTSGLSGAGGSPGGTNQRVQYNNAGNFGGIPGLYFDGTTVFQTTGGNYGLIDPTTVSKRAHFELQNITAGANRAVNIADGTSTTVIGATAGAGKIMSAISQLGVITFGYPDMSTLTPFSANQDNFTPPTPTYYMRVSSDGTRDLTGIVGAGVRGETHILICTGNSVVVKNENTNSTASNRFHSSTGADITLTQGTLAFFVYDTTLTRWVVTPMSGGGGGGGGGTPGGANTQMQYNAAGSFGGISALTTNGTSISATASQFIFKDATDSTKQGKLDLSNLTTGVSSTIVVPNSSNSVIVKPDTGSSHQFLTALSSLGVLSKAQPAFTDLAASEGTIGDTSGVWPAGRTVVRTTAAMTNNRSITLPAANTYPSAMRILYVDGFTSLGSSFKRTLNAAGSDTVNGTTSYAPFAGGGTIELETDGTSAWIPVHNLVQLTSIRDSSDPSKQATFDLSNITTATTRTVNIPDANSTTAQAKAAVTSNFLTAMSSQGVFSAAQPAFTDLSGTWTLSQGPTTTGSVLIGRGSSGTGTPQEIMLGSGLSMSGTTLSASGGGSGSPGGTSGDIQFNDSGDFGGFTPGTNVQAFLETPSSARLASALTDETGTGLAVFSDSPLLVTPLLGTPTSGNFSSGTFTWPTFNQDTTGSAASISISGQTGLMIFTGLTSTNRTKTVRNAADTILELGGSYTPTGTWTSLTMVTPVLGTPASGTLTNCTGLPASGIGSGTIAQARLGSGSDGSGTHALFDDQTYKTIAGGGDALTSNPLSQFAATTSSQLAGVMSDETGTGTLVFATSPTLVTPLLGTPTSGTLTNCTFPTLNQNTTGSAASLSVSGQTGLLTVTGLASTNRTKTVRDAADTILELGGSYTPTGTWTSLTMVTPVLGTPTSGTLTNCTFPTLNQNTTGSAATLTTTRTLWGQNFNGSANVNGNMTSVGNITGAAQSMTIIAGTGNSRTMTLQTTTSGGTATTAATIGATQVMDFANAPTVASVAVPTISSTSTFTNKRITPRVLATASSSSYTPNADSYDQENLTALAAACTINAPSGTPVAAQKLIIRLKDDGTARALTWNSIYRASSDLSLPTTTTLSKTLYCGFIYNSTDSKWDLLAKLDNF